MSKRDGGLQDVQGVNGWKAPTPAATLLFHYERSLSI
jgi:hypothetical protein